MSTIVTTRAGRLDGDCEDGVFVFRSIPRAKPPIGALRFAAPEPTEPWSGTRDATRFGPCAYQADTAGSPSGSADLTHPAVRALETSRKIFGAAGLETPGASGLRALSADELQATQDRATPRSAGVFYGPVVGDDVLPRHPFEAIADGSAAGVPSSQTAAPRRSRRS